jgi:hypothetical protein
MYSVTSLDILHLNSMALVQLPETEKKCDWIFILYIELFRPTKLTWAAVNCEVTIFVRTY